MDVGDVKIKFLMYEEDKGQVFAIIREKYAIKTINNLRSTHEIF